MPIHVYPEDSLAQFPVMLHGHLLLVLLSTMFSSPNWTN
jgi:hypothetical protein